MATYDDKYTVLPKTGKHVGIVFGKIHEGITPSGTPNDTLKDFVISPTTYGPFYPRESYAKDFVSTKADVTVYDDGVEATISTWTPSTGTASLSAAPATGSVMTADCVEQQELYIAQNATLTPKRETDDLNQLRNNVTRKSYGNTEFTLKADFKVADLEMMKLIFETTGTAGRYEYPDEPPLIYAAIVMDNDAGDAIEYIVYLEDIRADFSDILSAKAGKDAVENGFEMTVGANPIVVDVSESA